MSDSVNAALDAFMHQLRQLQTSPPQLPYDEAWPSECYVGTDLKQGEFVSWMPALQNNASDMFSRLETALDEKIHPDVVAFYTRYWSDPLPAKCEEGELSLLQVWNHEDMERLRSNLVGHALSKRQQKRPLTFFFACAEPNDDHFISVDNYTGEIWLELPGKPPIRPLAQNLAEFLNRLEPQMISDRD